MVEKITECNQVVNEDYEYLTLSGQTLTNKCTKLIKLRISRWLIKSILTILHIIFKAICRVKNVELFKNNLKDCERSRV